MSKQRRPALDPVITMALGIGFLTIAIVMLVTQNLEGKGFSIGIGTGFFRAYHGRFYHGINHWRLELSCRAGGIAGKFACESDRTGLS